MSYIKLELGLLNLQIMDSKIQIKSIFIEDLTKIIIKTNTFNNKI